MKDALYDGRHGCGLADDGDPLLEQGMEQRLLTRRTRLLEGRAANSDLAEPLIAI